MTQQIIPPAINPQDHAPATSALGQARVYRLRWRGQELVWAFLVDDPDNPDVWACESSEEASRVARFLEALYAFIGFGGRVGARFWETYVIDPDFGHAAAQILLLEEPEAWIVAELTLAPLNEGETAIHTGSCAIGENARERFAYVGGEAGQYDHLADALHAWTRRLRQWADTIDRRGGPLAKLSAAHLRSEADRVQAKLSRAALGDAARQLPDHLTSRTKLAGRLGVTRAFLYRVLAGQEWSLESRGD